MTTSKILITVGVLAFATILTRALPFLVFSKMKTPPKIVSYIGGALPAAMFALLFVYCLKGVNINSFPHALPETIAILVVVTVHILKREMLLSIATGTVVYMYLVQSVF